MNSYDYLHLEASPDQHDREAIVEGSTELDCQQLISTWQTHGAQSGPWLNIGCGTGRHLRALAERERQIIGLDVDERMIAAAQQHGTPAGCRYLIGDASAKNLTNLAPELDGKLALTYLLNRSLVCFQSHRQAAGLFHNMSQCLQPGGLFVIDNCCAATWSEIANGDYNDGLSVDGDQQLFFLPGDNRFVWRRGAAVDVDSWTPKPSDRIFRCWSLSEVALAAEMAALTLVVLDPAQALIVLRRDK